jgi:hypothetical protein
MKIPLGDREPAHGTISKLDTAITTRSIRTHQFIAMLSVSVDYKKGVLPAEKSRCNNKSKKHSQ